MPTQRFRGYEPLSTEDWAKLQRANVVSGLKTALPVGYGFPQSSPSPPTPSFDADAAAYLSAVISAGGSVDTTMSAATNTLFTSLKSASLYTKIKAFYPVLGGVAASHAINGNGNTSFDLTFNNGFSHDYSGLTPSNTNSYATTNYVPLTEHAGGTMTFGNYDNAVGAYAGGDRYMIGAYTSQSNFLSVDYGNTKYEGKYLQNSSTTSISVASISDRYGFIQLGSDGLTKYMSLYQDGSETAVSAAKDGGTLPNIEMYIGNINVTGSPYNSQQQRMCFAYMADYLTPSEMTSMATIVDTFQTSLSRNN